MQSHARVVIIGGGIMGASLLYHLAREGWSDCLLIEKGELTSGSTWHAAGQVTHSVSSYTLASMNRYAVELYQTIEAETEQSVSWHGCGSLRLAYNNDELDWLKYTLNLGRRLDLPMEIIGPDEIRALHPFYNLEGVLAALHTPNDGHVDPAGACFALAKGARQLGAKVVRHNRVTNIRREGNEWAVDTEQGTVRCEHVVNAGGTFARQIGAWLGLDLPITNMTHHYLVTETVPQFLDLEKELPVVRDDRLVSGYIRMEQKSALIGIYEKENPNTVWSDGTPWSSENELFEADLERIWPWLEAAMDRMPILQELGIKRTVHGAITHPPDGNMLLGPVPGLPNCWCACGSQIGIAWGPGSGKYLAQWMVHGAPEVSLRAFDPARYGDFAKGDYREVKAREDYILRHEVPFPGFNRMAGRPVKPTSLYEILKDRGAVFEEVYGWERPRWFAPPGMAQEDLHSFRRSAWFAPVGEECRAVRERVGVMDITAFTKLEVRGADAASLLDRTLANKLPKAGRIGLAHLLNHTGTIEAEITVTRLAEDHFFLTYAAVAGARIQYWLETHLKPGEDCAFEDVSLPLGSLAVAGPRAREVLAQLTSDPLDNAAFPWLSVRDITVVGVACRALRVSYTGELGWELYTAMDNLPALYAAIRDAGAAHGIADFGSHAMNSLRMEKAYRSGHELSHDATPLEAGLERLVRLDKPGGFVGQAALGEATPRFEIAYLAVDTVDCDCVGHEAVYDGERVVGTVSSGAYGHAVGQSLAFAYMTPGYAEPGRALEVLMLGERRAARVLAEPAHDPESKRLRV